MTKADMFMPGTRGTRGRAAFFKKSLAKNLVKKVLRSFFKSDRVPVSPYPGILTKTIITDDFFYDAYYLLYVCFLKKNLSTI